MKRQSLGAGQGSWGRHGKGGQGEVIFYVSFGYWEGVSLKNLSGDNFMGKSNGEGFGPKLGVVLVFLRGRKKSCGCECPGPRGTWQRRCARGQGEGVDGGAAQGHVAGRPPHSKELLEMQAASRGQAQGAEVRPAPWGPRSHVWP